jgi:hypothetical protein
MIKEANRHPPHAINTSLPSRNPLRRLRFRLALAVFQPSPSARPFRIRLILSCALPSLQSFRVTAGPALLSGHLPWASFPHRGISLRSPHSRASQARFVPSSTFLTSPTASSSAYLRGLVSSRNHVQGSLFRVFPWLAAARARRPPLPSCRCPTLLLPVLPRAPERRARLQGFAPLASPLQHATG